MPNILPIVYVDGPREDCPGLIVADICGDYSHSQVPSPPYETTTTDLGKGLKPREKL